MLISSRSPPPSPSYPTPITAIACPSIGNSVEIALEITIGGNESPKKTNARVFDPARWWQLDPFEKMVRWGRCQERLVRRTGGAAGWILYSGGGGGEVDSSDQQKFWRIMSSRHLFALCEHSSSAGAKLKKELLRQYLHLGLPGVLTKQLSAGASIAWGRMCRGDDLDDGVLMPKLS
jgi:hypothetical protein